MTSSLKYSFYLFCDGNEFQAASDRKIFEVGMQTSFTDDPQKLKRYFLKANERLLMWESY
jgi:hypothetical protein